MSGDTATRWWIPTSVVSSVGNNCLSTTSASTIRLNGTREEYGVGRSTTVGNVANPDTTTHRQNLRDLDSEMTSILDNTGIDVSEKVRLYNQALLRYDDLAKMSATKPTPVVVVKEKETPATTDIMGEVMTTLPKALQEKGRQLVSRLKTTQWNDRGELLHEVMVVPGSKVVDIVHDLLRKRKTSDPIGWLQFGSQMRAANIPMELVGNVVRRRHIQQRKRTLTPKQTKGR